jgi:hypothetical protein
MQRPIFLAFLAVLPLLLSCSVTEYTTLPLEGDYPADSYLRCKNHGGLFLASEALFDADRSKKYLYYDLKDEGFIPIVLYANNRSQLSFLLYRENVTLILPDGSELTPVDVFHVYREVKSPALFSGAQENLEMKLDYARKDFFRGRSGVRLGSKNNAAGIIFFQIPRGQELRNLTDAVLKLSMVREKGAGQAESEKVQMLVDVE